MAEWINLPGVDLADNFLANALAQQGGPQEIDRIAGMALRIWAERTAKPATRKPVRRDGNVVTGPWQPRKGRRRHG